MVIKYEPLNRRDRIVKLFREAIEAENARELERALRTLDEILELSKDNEPEFYFEACFRMADIHIQRDNYRGAVKCALRGILKAPSSDHYRLGIKRLGDILFILKEEERLKDITENMDATLSLIKEDEELYRFTLALIRLAMGEEVKEAFPLREFNDVIESLKDE